MDGLIKGALAVAALAGIGYVGYKHGRGVIDAATKMNLHRCTGRYGDPAAEETYTKPAPAQEGK